MTEQSIEQVDDFIKRYRDELKDTENMADFGGLPDDKTIDGIYLKHGFKNPKNNLDFKADFDLMDFDIKEQFDWGLCMDTLEHVERPFDAAKNIARSLKKGALLFVTVPFAWEKHDHPDDFFRYTTSGLKALFKGLLEPIEEHSTEEGHHAEWGRRYRTTVIFKKV